TYYAYPDLAQIAGEVLDPSRTLPRILLGGLAATAVLYLALNAAFLQVLPLERIAASNLVAADVMDTLVGARGGALVAGLALLVVLASLNGNLFVAVYAALFAGTVRAQPTLVAGALAMLGVAYALSWIVKTDRAAPVAE